MKFKSLSIALAASAFLAATPAMAQDASGITAGISAGSLGAGPELGYRINDTVGVRASASFLDLSHDFDIGDIAYSGKTNLESYGATVDVYPFNGGFRVSGGFRIDKNRVNLTAAPTADVTVGDLIFSPADVGTLTGRVDADEFVPVLTIGYAGGLTKGLKFGIDGGVMFQGKPVAQQLVATGALAENEIFQAELEKERLKVNQDMEDFQYYPVLQFSIFYAF